MSDRDGSDIPTNMNKWCSSHLYFFQLAELFSWFSENSSLCLDLYRSNKTTHPNTFVILPLSIFHCPQGVSESASNTRSPIFKFRCSEFHFTLLMSEGKYSFLNLFQKWSASNCTCLHLFPEHKSWLVNTITCKCPALPSIKWLGASISLISSLIYVSGQILMMV